MEKKPDAFVLLHPGDNVFVCCHAVDAGSQVEIDGETIVLTESIEVGHKIARQSLESGDRIVKYGAPIGSATRAVARGEHIHRQNLASDYIPSHTRDKDE